MKTFITGGTGILGSYVIRELLQRGHSVKVLVKKGSEIKRIKGAGVEIYEGDLSDENHLFKGCRDFDFIIHSEDQTPQQSDKFNDFIDSNIKGTKNIMRAAERAGIKRVIYVSSYRVFGSGTREDPGIEISEFNGYRFGSGYINSKYIAHQWVLSEIEKRKLPVVIVHPTNLISPLHGNDIVETISGMLQRRIRFYTTGGTNFIDVRDAAVATCNALTMGHIGESYLLASENLSWKELFSRIKKHQSFKGMNIYIPKYLFNFIGLLGSLAGRISNRYHKLNLTNTYQLTCESYFSGAKAVRELKLPQHPVDQALQEMFIGLNDKVMMGAADYKLSGLSPTG